MTSRSHGPTSWNRVCESPRSSASGGTAGTKGACRTLSHHGSRSPARKRCFENPPASHTTTGRTGRPTCPRTGEIDEVRRLFPEAGDYLEVYERGGGAGERAILAHAIHLSDSEVDRLAASGAGVAHCPASNLFLSSGMMAAARYVDAGIRVGLGSDLAAGPEMSLFGVMRAAAVTQQFLKLSGRLEGHRPLRLLDWLRLGTLHGARALGIDDRVGSIEVGKDADLILVDPERTAPVPGAPFPDEPDELLSRLIFRAHPQMVRGAWVRGRLLPAEHPSGGLGALTQPGYLLDVSEDGFRSHGHTPTTGVPTHLE